MSRSPAIIVLTNYFLPGYRGGGPIRTLANLVDQLGEEFRFRIVTSDRDALDREPYPGLSRDVWQPLGNGEVLYLSPANQSAAGLRKILCDSEHKVLYLNSFFSPRFAGLPLLLRRLKLIPRMSVVLAPRGEFSPGALAFKKSKKCAYIRLVRRLGLYRDVLWQASSELEEQDIRAWFGDRARVVVAANLPARLIDRTDGPAGPGKKAGSLRVIFLSRICGKKNLDGALRVLQTAKGDISFSIYGPIEDPLYWGECQKLISRMPANIDVSYKGVLRPEQVRSAMEEHDLFFFPTHGENFGHVILEALVAGCPVLLSDQTPWRDLREKGVGWDLPLAQPHHFRQAIEECVAMDTHSHRQWSERARAFGRECSRNEAVVEQNRELLRQALALG